jgi:hypothetical protein
MQVDPTHQKKPKSISVKKKNDSTFAVKLLNESKEHIATFTPMSQAK